MLLHTPLVPTVRQRWSLSESIHGHWLSLDCRSKMSAVCFPFPHFLISHFSFLIPSFLLLEWPIHQTPLSYCSGEGGSGDETNVTAELQERFCDTLVQGIGLLQLLPTQCCTFDIGDTMPQNLTQAVAFYEPDLPRTTMENQMWVRKWKQHTSDFPKKLEGVLQACGPITFSNVTLVLQLAPTLSITSCESERGFSRLKLIKTSHHSTIALVACHWWR